MVGELLRSPSMIVEGTPKVMAVRAWTPKFSQMPPIIVGDELGPSDGIAEGEALGASLGMTDGLSEGESLGEQLGIDDGLNDGEALGEALGLSDGPT
jgi:hypothetical protein